MNYVRIEPGRFPLADMVNLVASAVNDDPARAKQIARGITNWEVTAGDAINFLSSVVEFAPNVGDAMVNGLEKSLAKRKGVRSDAVA